MAKRKIFLLNKDLQEGLTQTMSAVKHYAGELHFEIIPLSQIEFDPDNPRDLRVEFSDLPEGPGRADPFYHRKMDEISKLNSLAETINTQGLINPVLVYKHGSVYRLIAGERRCLASKIAGKSEIKANILNERPNEYRQRLLQWIENVEREDLTLWERLQNIKMILSAYQKQNNVFDEISPGFIKNILGCSMPHATNYYAVLKAPKIVTDAVLQNQLKNLEKAAFIARVTDGSLQEQLLHACVAGASLKQLKSMQEQNEQAVQQQKKQAIATKLAAGRGRKVNQMDLGTVKEPIIIKTLIESVIEQDRYRHYHSRFVSVDWNDFVAVASAFKEMVSIIQLVETR